MQVPTSISGCLEMNQTIFTFSIQELRALIPVFGTFRNS